MSATGETLTYLGRRIIYSFLSDNPATTVVGAGLGVGASAIYEVLGHYISPQPPSVARWIWVVLFVAIANARVAFRRVPLPEGVDAALLLIDRARAAGVSHVQINSMYRRLFDYVLEKAGTSPAELASEAAIAVESLPRRDS